MPNSRPTPDYVGPRYRGLVVIGANPGIAFRSKQKANDAHTFELQDRIAAGDRVAYDELLLHLPESMLGWQQMVNGFARQFLRYDIEEIAYINLVKCATTTPHSDVHNLFRNNAKAIPQRCWDANSLPLLESLRPRFIAALWRPVLGSLRQLGYLFAGVEMTGAYNGQRNLPIHKRYEDVKKVFDAFNLSR